MWSFLIRVKRDLQLRKASNRVAWERFLVQLWYTKTEVLR